jgi:hypothetical protein
MLNIDHAPIVPAMALFVTSLKSVKSLGIRIQHIVHIVGVKADH